ncbi:MAG: hypothetical protein K0S29_844 [Gammaproteobacteria bacterium]|jgi:uncharacterized protein (DUF2062 family)|nr:hypothetical protein [Gammaproteobacteria bacterium]
MKKHFKKLLPDFERFAQDKGLSRIRNYLFNPLLWHVNRRSIAKGAAIGLLIAFVPLPMQMLLAAIFAIVFRANLPIAIALTWITNPVTFLPINYVIFKVGEFVLNDHSAYHVVQAFEFDKSWRDIASQLLNWLHSVGKPYLFGLPIVAISASILSYGLIQIVWRLSIYFRLKKRKKSQA